MKNILTKKTVHILISALVFSIAFALFQYSSLNALHGQSDAPLIVAFFGVIALIISTIFEMKATIVAATFGYILSYILGILFNTNGVDAGGATANNLWIIWLMSYWVFIGVGAIADVVSRIIQKQKKLK